MKVFWVVDLHHSVSHGLWKELIVLQKTATDEFRRQRQIHGKKVSCRKGCDACCHTPFVITEIEAAAIGRAVRAFSAELQQRLREKSRSYIERRATTFKSSGYREGRGELAPSEARLPCPALDEGRCSIYQDRPIVCRLYGVALIHPSYGDRVFACQLNFAPGEHIEDPDLAQRQHQVAGQRAALEAAYSGASGLRFREPITVAHALL
jgi:Fe-S-cluster containining protein